MAWTALFPHRPMSHLESEIRVKPPFDTVSTHIHVVAAVYRMQLYTSVKVAIHYTEYSYKPLVNTCKPT